MLRLEYAVFEGFVIMLTWPGTIFKVWGAGKENRIPTTKWQWNLFYSKVIARNISTFIPLGDETFNSSLVERGRSLMDPQPHPLLHFLVRMKPRSTNVFLQVAKNVEVTRGKIWAVRRMLKCFPAKSLKLIPHQIGSMGTSVIMQKMIPSDSVPGVLTLSRGLAPSATKKRTTPLCSSLLASISNAEWTHFTLCSPPEQ